MMDLPLRVAYDVNGPLRDRDREEIQSPHAQSPGTQPSSLSSSLLNSLDSLTRLRSFFNVDDVPFPENVKDFPAADERSAKTRLEVLTSWEITFTTLSLYIVAAISVVYTFYITHNLRASEISVIPLPSDFRAIVATLLNVISFFLAVLYSLRLTLGPEPLEHEQISTAILLATGFLCRNPLTTNLHRLHPTTQLVVDSIYTFVCYFYLFSAAHSYRVQDTASLPFDFYLPKISFLSIYVSTKAVLTIVLNVSLPLIPFSSLIPYVILFSSYRVPTSLTLSVIIVTFLDSLLLLSLTKQVTTTAFTLAKISYLRHRAKQLGFRCFVYQSLAFANAFLFICFAVGVLTPRKILYHMYESPAHSGWRRYYLRLESQVGGLPLALVYTMWTLILAYVNLPPGPIWPWKFGADAIGRVQNGLCRLFGQYSEPESDYIQEGNGGGYSGTDQENESGEDHGDDASRHRMRRKNTLFGRGMLPSQMLPYRYSHREWSTLDTPSRNQEKSHGVSNTNAQAISHSEGNPTGCRSQYGGVSPVFSPLDSHLSRLIDTDPFHSHPFYGATSWAHHDLGQPFRRLGMKKNLLIMETQAMLMNAAYLSYLPGNPEEEAYSTSYRYPSMSSPSYHKIRRESSSLARCGGEELDDPLLYSLSNDDEDENCEPHSDQEYKNDEFYGEYENYVHPLRDDGTFFRVDISRLAQERGYAIKAHFVDNEINAHAIILSGKDRVIVAFSGTRDARNWASNMQLAREMWSEMFWYSPFDQPPVGGHDEGLWNDSKDMTSMQHRKASRSSTRWSQNPSGSISRLHPSSSEVGASIARELATLGQPKIHRGFGRAYKRLRFPVFDTLKGMFCKPESEEEPDIGEDNSEGMVYRVYSRGKRPRKRGGGGEAVGKRLFFCGHSLGGAIATYACYDASRNWKELGVLGRDDIACTTFGCPKVGNAAFQAQYNATVLMHWRFELAGDPIVGMPSLLNYVHVGTQALLDRSGELLIDPSFVERAWWASLPGALGGYRLHFKASYMEAMRKYARKFENGSDSLNDVFWPFPTSVQTKGLFSK